MREPVSRIEREYLLKSLIEMKPDLDVVFSESVMYATDDMYAIHENILSLFFVTTFIQNNTPVRICFDHRKRGVYFDSVCEKKINQKIQIVVPAALYYDDEARFTNNWFSAEIDNGSGVVQIGPGPFNNLFGSAPGDLQNLNSQKREVIAKALAFEASSTTGPDRVLAVIGLITDDTGIRHRLEVRPQLLYADHRTILVSVSRKKPAVSELSRGDSMLRIGSRKIRGTITGGKDLNITGAIAVIRFDFKPFHEEDMRFLYEETQGKLYN